MEQSALIRAGSGVPKPVAVRHSRDRGEARDWLTSRYAAHELRADARSTRFEFLHASVPIKHGSANLLQYGSAVKIEPEAFEDFYMLEMPLEEGADITLATGGQRSSAPGSALLIPPGLAFSSRWRAGTRQFMLQLDAGDVQRHWRQLVQDETSQLPAILPVIDFSNDEGWRVQQLLMLLMAEFERGVGSAQPSVTTSPLSTAVIDGVLDYIRTHHRDCYAAEQAVPLPAALARALRHVRLSLPGEIAVFDLAAVAGVSERSLYALFSSFLRTSPHRFIEAKRLEHARAYLLSDAVGVAEAARAAGFRHMGRFSRAYRDAYGELPSETLSNR